MCSKKRLPSEVKRQCRMFEFECFNSQMAQKCIERYSREYFYACVHGRKSQINKRVYSLAVA